MKTKQHVWLARCGVFVFLLALFMPASAISGGGRGFWLFIGAALCLMYIWKEQRIFQKSASPSWADLLPKVMVPGLVILLTPVFALIR
ncbi:MAG: hypothetical protein IPJ28_21450 [Betaproteobacteria bacterium]|nr:hypothetical protein [Betaproteobacteria bacterium]